MGAFDDLRPKQGGLFDDLRPEKPSIAGEFGKGIKGGIEATKQAGYGIAALAGNVTGIKPVEEFGLEGVKRTAETMRSPELTPAVGKVEDVGSVREATLYGAQGLGQMVPFMATSVAGAGVGGLIARGAGRAAAGAAAEQAIARGAIAGAAATSVGTETGLIHGQTYEETGKQDPALSLAYGAAAGALDVLPEARLIGQVVGKTAVKKGARAIAKDVGKQAGLEAATEGAQTVLENAPAAHLDPQGHPLVSPENASDVLNSAIIGGLGGGVMGAGGYAVGALRRPAEQPESELERAMREAASAPPPAATPAAEAPFGSISPAPQSEAPPQVAPSGPISRVAALAESTGAGPVARATAAAPELAEKAEAVAADEQRAAKETEKAAKEQQRALDQQQKDADESLDARVKAMNAEAGSIAEKAEAAAPKPKAGKPAKPVKPGPLHDALETAAAEHLDPKDARKALATALKEDRPDVAAAIVERAERIARVAESATPGVPESSPAYTAIADTLKAKAVEARKVADDLAAKITPPKETSNATEKPGPAPLGAQPSGDEGAGRKVEGQGVGGAHPEQIAGAGVAEAPGQAAGDRPIPQTAVAPKQQLFVDRGGRRFPVASLEEAGSKWSQFREQTGAGASKIGEGATVVDQDGKEVARISYNGKVWPPGEWRSGMKPIVGENFKPSTGRDEVELASDEAVWAKRYPDEKEPWQRHAGMKVGERWLPRVDAEIEALRAAHPLEAAAHQAATSPTNDLPEPTSAQAKAGNYQKGHVKVGGLDVSIENPEGSTRSDKEHTPPRWSNEIKQAHYGYIRSTVGADEEHIDTFVKPGTSAGYDGPVFVVDQVGKDGKFDEHKVLLGYPSHIAAVRAYKSNYPADFKVGKVTKATMGELKAWMADRALTAKPYAERESEKPLDAGAVKPPVVDTGGGANPSSPPGDRWTGDRGAIPGEPFALLDADENDIDTAKAALIEVEVAGRGVVYEARLPGGKLIGAYSTSGEAATAAERAVDAAGKRHDAPQNAKTSEGSEGVAERFQYATEDANTPKSLAEAKRLVVDAMNGDITVDALVEKLRASSLMSGQVMSITNRLGDRLSPSQQRHMLVDKLPADYDGPLAYGAGSRRERLGETKEPKAETAPPVPENPVKTGLKFTERRHTKTGEPLHVVKMGERVERDEYLRLNAAAKTMGGSYSTYVKGFIFKDKAKAEAFIAREGGTEPVQTGAVPVQSMPAEQPPAKKPVTPQVEALPGTAPLGAKPVELVIQPLRPGAPAVTLTITPEPKWWTDATGAERFDKMKASGIKGTGYTRWTSLTLEQQQALDRQWGPRVATVATPATPQERAAEVLASSAPDAPFAKNTIFTADKVQAARERLRKKLGTVTSGVDPETMMDGITIAGAYIEAGVRSFTDYSAKMIADFGEAIRPMLRSFYEGARHWPGLDTTGMTPSKDIDEHVDTGSKKPTIPTQEGGDVLVQPRGTDRNGPEALATPPAGEVRGARSGGDVGAGASVSGKPDVGGDGDRPGGGLQRERSLGNGAGELPAATGGAERGPTPGQPGVRGDRGREPGAAGAVTPGEPYPIARDFVITDELELGKGSTTQKYAGNVEAIRLLKQIEDEHRTATPAEQNVLARYVGWGGIKQVFPPPKGKIAKGWESRVREVRDLLTPEEHAAAARSIQDAHYTSRTVVDAIWNIARRLGFDGGRVLEPSMGTGNFIGLMPSDMKAESAITGIELDSITARIAKQLYPQSNILGPIGFHEVQVADEAFNLSVGNPPFGQTVLYDPSAKHLRGFSLHNFFFAKAIDKLAPGGIHIQVVSRYLMDAADSRSREYLAHRTELVGAIRLPWTAFYENANTEVVTDIIVLRKLPEADWGKAGQSWTQTTEIPDPTGKDPIKVNQYFADHPEMILGELNRTGEMIHENDITVQPRDGEALSVGLDRATAMLPKDLYQRAQVSAREATVNAEGHDVGSFFVHEGKLVQTVMEDDGSIKAIEINADTPYGEASTWGKTRVARVRGMLDVRDTARALLRAEVNDSDVKDIDAARAALNKSYDAFVAEHDYLNDQANERAFRGDPDAPLLIALEHNYDGGISPTRAKALGVPRRKASAEKMPIFRQRVIHAHHVPEHVADVAGAVQVSISETGRVQPTFIAKLMGKSEAEAVEALTSGEKPIAYLDPATQKYELASDYLSGNVKRKHAEAVRAGLTEQAEALKAVFPPDLKAGDIRARLGAPWIDKEAYSGFVKHLFGPSAEGSIAYIPQSGGFSVTINGGDAALVEKRWGVHTVDLGGDRGVVRDGRDGKDILARVLNSRDLTVFHTDKKGNRFSYPEVTQALADKADEMRQEFENWVFDELSQRERLVGFYNDHYNTNVQPSYDGSYLTLPGKVPDDVIRFRRHQLNAVARVIHDGKGLLDHVVGAGKTFTIVAAVMEQRRLGLKRKPMIVVPNHLVNQWATDFYRLYPGAKILSMDKKDFEKKNRQRMLARVATGDWDAVIFAHSSFGFIENDRAVLVAEVDKQIAQMQEAIDIALENEGKKSRTAAQYQKAMDAARQRLKALADKPRDRVLTFQDLGVDMLTIDESQEFKNLFFTTQKRNVGGFGNPTGSKRAFDLYVKGRWIQTKHEDTGLLFATGTPISNSMTELYTLQRYLALNELEGRGLRSLDAWLNTFGVIESEYESNVTGTKYKRKERLRRITNAPEAVQMYKTFADSVTLDDIKRNYAADNDGASFPVPKVKGGKPRANITVEASEAQREFSAGLQERMENLSSDMKKDNALAILGDGRKAALDIRLVDRTQSDNPGSKASVATDEIKRIYDANTHRKGTQLVFLDLSTPLKQGRSESIGYLKEARKLLDMPNAYPFGTLTQQWNNLRNALEERRDSVDEETGDTGLIDRIEKFLDQRDDISAAVTTVDSGFSVYDDMRAKLIEKGIPEKEVAFIHDYNTDLRKQDLFDQVNAGTVRVLLGSTAKMGAGTNVQRKLVALHHMDCPWRPSDIEQREGRIIRQGNEFRANDPDFEVEINAYATVGTSDVFFWQTQEKKLIAINSLRNFKGEREIEETSADAMSAAEMKALASGNPLILEDVKLTEDVRKLESSQRRFVSSKRDLESEVAKYERRIASLPDEIKRQEQLTAKVRAYQEDPFDGKRPTVDVDGKAMDPTAALAHVREVAGAAEDAVRPKNEPITRRMAEIFIQVKEHKKESAEYKAFEAEYAKLEAEKVKPEWSVTVAGKAYKSEEGAKTAIERVAGDVRPFKITLTNIIGSEPKEYIRRDDAAKHLDEIVGGWERTGTGHARVGNVGGIPIELDWISKTFSRGIEVNVGGETSHYGVSDGLAPKGENVLAHIMGAFTSIPSELDRSERWLAEAKNGLEPLRSQIKGEWDKGPLLAEKRERLAMVRTMLAGTAPHAQPAAAPDLDTIGDLNFNSRDAMLHAAAKRGASAKTIYSLIRGAGNGFYTALIDRLEANGIAPKFEVPEAKRTVKVGSVEVPSMASYSPGTNTVKLYTYRNAVSNVVHELVHAATYGAIERGTLPGKSMVALYEQVKASGLANNKAYGMTSVHEFVAEAHANPTFQAMLAAIPVDRGAIRNAWDAFVDIVRRILGLPVEQRDALAQALKVAADLVEYQGRFNAQAPPTELHNVDQRFMVHGPTMIFDGARNLVADLTQSDRFVNRLGRKWHTPFHFAEKFSEFTPVYKAAQSYLHDINSFARKAQNEALNLLVRIESFKDFTKAGAQLAKDADIKALHDALMTGTLWGGGNPLEGRKWTDEEMRSGRAQVLDQGGRPTGTTMETGFAPMTDTQIKLYHQALNLYASSLSEFAKSLIWRNFQIKKIPLDADVVREASLEQAVAYADSIADQQIEAISLRKQVAAEDHAARVAAAAVAQRPELERAHAARVERYDAQIADWKAVKDETHAIASKTHGLIEHGYFSAMRFGNFAVNVEEIDADGNSTEIAFHRFDSPIAANQAKRTLATEHGGTIITKEQRMRGGLDPGVYVVGDKMNPDAYKLFNGLNLDALSALAEHIKGDDGKPISTDPLMQQYFRLAVSERSTLKRQIHRKGTAGWSTDIPRVLAHFATSNASATSRNYHGAELVDAAMAIRRGDLQQYATDYVRYLQDPAEESQRVRSFLANFYILGSIASGAVNMTQPLLVTAPYLTQYTSYADSMAKLGKASLDYARGAGMTPAERRLYDRGVEEGVIAPQEIHQLRADTQASLVGDSPLFSQAKALADKIGVPFPSKLAMRRLSFLWGSIYSMTEQFNRGTTFIAALRIAREQGYADPYEFAVKAVESTQFTYNKGNRPELSRGKIGSVVMTFKQFNISYFELFQRMVKREDKKPAAVLMLTLLALAGSQGLPFADDIEDLIDTIGQWMGYSTNSKASLRKWAERMLGQSMANVMLHGVSSIPGVPFDVAQRLGMQNLIPGTALLKTSSPDSTRDIVELMGPAASLFQNLKQATTAAATGQIGGALKSIAPVALANVAKGADMLESGMYRDARGRKIADVSTTEALFKMVGLQPQKVASIQRTIGENQQDITLHNTIEDSIVQRYAMSVVDQDPALREKAMTDWQEWNRKNPEQPIRITPQQFRQRIQNMRVEKGQRQIGTAPPELRGEIRESLR